jgi:diguanylate cyclase (GGDEF)-like protein
MKTPKRCTVGVLIGFQVFNVARLGTFTLPFVRGLQAAARDKGVNLMVACGISRGNAAVRFRPAWPDVQADMDFVPVGPWNTDGLIFLVPLRSKARIDYSRRLAEEGFPVLFIGADAGRPAIIVDNEAGIRQAMEHLVQHGHRSIAFIGGDEQDAGDSVARMDAFRQGVGRFGLDADPRLLEYGQHWENGGYDAMRRLLRSGVKFTAVMCSNDLSALGVMKALREAGIRIPADLAVTGFDDVLEDLAQVPPLTSVHFPMFETGYRALLLLLDRIAQGADAIPEVTRVSTWLVPRQSCGCLPDSSFRSAQGSGWSIPSGGIAPDLLKKVMAKSMLNAVSARSSSRRIGNLLPLCNRLLDTFAKSLADGNPADFHLALTEFLQYLETTGDGNASVGHAVISVLREGAYVYPPEDRNRSRSLRAEDLLHQARILLSESADRRYTRLQVDRTNIDENMGLLTARLMAASDAEQVYSALREDLSQVGVRSCHVALFEPQGGDPVAASRLQPLEKDAPVIRFESRSFPPPGLYPENEPFNLALLPLFFQKDNMGYVAFDGGNLDPLATLVRQLASSIKNVDLHAKVLELSLTDGLTGVHNRRFLEIILQKETERSLRYKRDLAVIMIDIDRFKRYNDAFGHPAGDEALREVARSIGAGARRGLDVLTRYGGEEFVIILPETDAAGAQAVAEGVRRQVEQNPTFLQPMTVSLGIATLAGNPAEAQALVDRADRAMYQAKCRGRNRAVVFEDWMLDAAHLPEPEGSDSGLETPS